MKGYPAPRPFLCLVRDAAAARALAREWPWAAERLAAEFWPGPLTLVVPAGGDAPDAVSDRGTIALRPAADPVSAALLAAWRGPLFSTSANRRGEPPSEAVADALRALRGVEGSDAIGVALASVPSREPREPGLRPRGRPSTIVDVSTEPPRVLRPGALSLDRIREIVPQIRAAVDPACDRSPGRPS